MDVFQPFVREWFLQSFAEPTEVQRRGWPLLAAGKHALLLAPTGSGKTLAAFLWSIDRLTRLPPHAPPGVRILYVSPLKALVYDIERNLRAPLVGIRRRAERESQELRPIEVAIRTGDTTPKERRRQLREPSEILVTTPESLFLLLGSQARETLRTVHTVIVDEIHSLAPSKRGVHLSLSLERLSELTEEEPQRVGLSATVRPPEVASRFLGGDRTVEVVDASAPARLELSIRVPVPDMEQVPTRPAIEEGGPILGERIKKEKRAREESGPVSIWSMIYPELLALIQKHRSTIVFVNSRSLAERLSQRLNELAEEPLVRAHHGSVSHDKRGEIEEALKVGQLKAIVATSSLELGIDMGNVDLVVLVESPGSVARGLQRVGRAGHGVGEKSLGVVFPKYRGDLLECAVVSERMLAGEIEALRVPENALDVLAQQIVAICADGPRGVGELEALVHRAAPYRELPSEVFVAVLDMLSGHFPSQDFADLKPRLSWDRAKDVLTARKGARMISLLNAGTIPDRGLYSVHIGEERGPRVGELDEEMVHETRKGETFLLGATSWRVEAVTRDRVVVSPAPGEPGKMPFWRGDGPGRPLELGRALGRFVRELGAMTEKKALRWVAEHTPLDEYASRNLVRYVAQQKEHTGALPTDRTIVVERFRDELGDWRICLLTPFGSRVHAPWALALQSLLSARAGYEVETMYTDDGIVLRFADVEELPGLELLLPEPEEVEERVIDELANSALFASTFRENAARALLLPRRRADRRTPLWQQRLRAKNLLAAVRRFPSFPIVLETYRQCMKDIFDLPALEEVLRGVQSRELHVVDVETPSASPFARSLTFAYVAAYLYEQDAPLAERKAQALTLDRNLLRELLGQAELRELIDASVLEEVEAELAGTASGWQARSADELEDLLRRVGDLTEEEIAERTDAPAAGWLTRLERERRAVRVQLAGEERVIAATDAARYRDALGVVPPPGLPDSLLASAEAPLEGLLRRYARTHGPFLAEAPAERFGLLPAQVEPVLAKLESEDRLLRGEIRPGGVRPEWCDTDVLRRLKRRTLAKLRKEVAPVDASVLGRFLPEWHGVDTESRLGLARLEETLVPLEGLALPWSTLVGVILPARVADFRVEMLDMLSASGVIVWVGAGALGANDGRVALYRRSHAALLLREAPEHEPASELEEQILAQLSSRGASFTRELTRSQDDFSLRAVEAALGNLLWAGRITNDTFGPLRGLGARAHRRRGRTAKSVGGRWSLVSHLADPELSDTERAHARVQMLLERYGIVSREAALHEEIPGGFKSLYPILKEMEERGRLRRGYFIEGLSGTQFALAGAVERLRAARGDVESAEGEREVDIRAYAAVDPANPYGALLPWPRASTDRKLSPRRVPGAFVLLHRGELVMHVERGVRRILSFGNFAEPAVARAAIEKLKDLPGRRRRSLRLEWIDGERSTESRHAAAFYEAGFFQDYQSLVYAHTPSGQPERRRAGAGRD